MKYGSTVNGLASQGSSDLDLTLLTVNDVSDHESLLLDIKELLLQRYGPKRYAFENSYPVRMKSGFILQVKDTFLDIKIDFMINRRSEVLNSLLLLEYCQLDSRFIKVAQTLKLWNQSVSPYKHERLNNYSLYLMLIAYMQYKGILPNLQDKAASSQNRRMAKHQVSIETGYP